MKGDLGKVDLDLLLTLEALLADASVSRVAARLGLTQPALSARLSRLRGLFDDPLFVVAGAGRGLVATDRAMELRPLVAEVMSRMRDLLALPNAFDPATSNRTFVIAAHENPAAMLAPELVPRVRSRAPDVRIAFVIPDPLDTPSRLEGGRYDIVVGNGARADPDLKGRTLFAEDLLCAQRRGHPRGTGPLGLDEFCALDHLLISAEGGAFEGAVDEVLTTLGRRRRVSTTIQHYALALLVVARSDLVCTLPRRFLGRFESAIDMFEPPLPLGRFELSAFWHARQQADFGHRWFREQVFEAASATGRG